MKLVIFEDNQSDHFLPLSWVRAVFELKCGAATLGSKIEGTVGRFADGYIARDYLTPVLKRRFPDALINDLSRLDGDETLLVNARAAVGLKFPTNSVAGWHDDVLAFWKTRTDVRSLKTYEDLVQAARKSDTVQHDGKWFDYIWDLMLASPHEIISDFKASGRGGIEGEVHESAVIYGPHDQLYVGRGATVQPMVCIDTRNGPVTLEAGVDVHPFTRIEGPCYVGAKSILLGAKIREGCSIGPMCRIGGEVEESIIHGYSNKYHDGFLGHAYVGEWVNLGALTTNSDLKNDYSSVSVIWPGNEPTTPTRPRSAASSAITSRRALARC